MLFGQKVQVAMESSGKHPLEGEVHVDGFEIGAPRQGERGRSKGEKKVRLAIALGHRDGKAGRGHAKVTGDYGAGSPKPIFECHIDRKATVISDGWKGYLPLKGDWPKLEQVPSDNGKNLKTLQLQIRNFKNWPGGRTPTAPRNTCTSTSTSTSIRANAP